MSSLWGKGAGGLDDPLRRRVSSVSPLSRLTVPPSSQRGRRGRGSGGEGKGGEGQGKGNMKDNKKERDKTTVVRVFLCYCLALCYFLLCLQTRAALLPRGRPAAPARGRRRDRGREQRRPLQRPAQRDAQQGEAGLVPLVAAGADPLVRGAGLLAEGDVEVQQGVLPHVREAVDEVGAGGGWGGGGWWWGGHGGREPQQRHGRGGRRAG